MKILRTVAELTGFCDEIRKSGKTLGLVPTMGALHAGHMSLVKASLKENDATVVSIFVNPTQFNNSEDLATYPRTEDADLRLLEQAGTSAAFVPSVKEIYPPSDQHDTPHKFDLGNVAEVMEGAMRPGHFQGVAQIVSKLMRISSADRAYFGEKDFQQIAVIRRMVKTEGIDIQIVACPIVREEDGLALSSRNVRLTPAQRAIAPGIHKILNESVRQSAVMTVKQVHDYVVEAINNLDECRVEYFSIVDAMTLQEIRDWNDSSHVQGCITVYCGDVRLIDNIRYR